MSRVKLWIGILAVMVLALGLLLAPQAQAIIAYDVTTIQTGNQAFTGSLGMDFDVLTGKSILVTDLGVFDSGGDGIVGTTLHAAIFNRDTQIKVTNIVDFSTSSPGDLIGGSRFKDVADVTLGPGHYSIVAWGYNDSEKNGNLAYSGISASTMNDGGGLISFVGTSRYSLTAGVYPDTIGAGPENRYLAGTLEYTPTPSTMLLLGSGMIGLAALGWRSRKKS